MRFETTRVYNFEGAFHGMRNPMNSWDKSDSIFATGSFSLVVAKAWEVVEKYMAEPDNELSEEIHYKWLTDNCFLNPDSTELGEFALIGPKDLKLATTLAKSGSEHRKYSRQIFVRVDITAPLYWWKEFDTYKVGTTSNSTSTMHKIHSKPIELSDFETDDYEPRLQLIDPIHLDVRVDEFLTDLEQLRQLYLQTNDKKYWKELIRWLPESYLQTRTITMTYENLFNMYHQRKNHKLTEWHQFCDWVKTLPYANELLRLSD